MSTVLVVEDNEFNMRLARMVLTRGDHRVLEASTAEDGLRLAREHRPAVVLLDIQLPGMDGVAALRELRGDPRTRELVVIAVTASVMKGERDRIMAAGFDAHLGKPYRGEDLLELVERAATTGRPHRADPE